MYSFGYDKSKGLLVGLHTGGGEVDLDADADIYIQTLKQLEMDNPFLRVGVASIIVVEDGYPRPNANIRKRLAEIRSATKVLFYFSLVTSSVLARGVVTALNWIQPSPPNCFTVTHPDFQSAVRWVEQKRGQKEPSLVDLYAKACARAGRTIQAIR
jgi:hypothetical protein